MSNVLPPAEPLREQCPDGLLEAAVEPGTPLVRNLVLLGPESRNGYRYAAEAMRQAAPLYEGRPVFVDHAADAPTRRALRDFAGQVTQPRFEDGRVRGDLRLLGPNAAWLLELVQAAPRDVGLSHVVLARRNAAGTEVERIERVVSVDIVAFPATVQSFREQHVPPPPAVPPPAPAAEGERRDFLGRLVGRSRLPQPLRSAALRQLLLGCPDPERFLAELESCWAGLAAETPVSRPRPAVPDVRQAVRAAIRGA